MNLNLNKTVLIVLLQTLTISTYAEDCGDKAIYYNKLRAELDAKPGLIQNARSNILNEQTSILLSLAAEIQKATNEIETLSETLSFVDRYMNEVRLAQLALRDFYSDGSAISALTQELKRYNNSNYPLTEQLEKALQSTKANRRLSSQQLRKLESLIALLSSENTNSRAFLRAIETQIAGLKMTSEQARQSLAEMIERLLSLEEETATLKVKLTQSLKTATTFKAKLESDVVSSQKRIQTFENEIVAHNSRTNHVHQIMNQLYNQIKECDRMYESLRGGVK